MVIATLILASVTGQPIGPPAWSAQWIWGEGQEDSPTGFLRRGFTVDEPIDALVIQMSGDDGYELLFDGEPVASGGFWWLTTNRYVIEAIGPGSHVLAARVRNAARPGGLLLDAKSTDGRLHIVTDDTWRFATEAPDDFAEVGFSDAGWEPAFVIGPPPVSPWGDLPLEYVGPTLELEHEASRIEVRDRSIEATIEAVVRTPQPAPRHCVLSLSLGDRPMERLLMEPRPETETWQQGQRVRLTARIEVPEYAPAGRYRVSLGPCGAELDGDPGMTIGEVDIVDEAAEFPLAEVRSHGGAPCLFVDGEPTFPMMFMSVPIVPEDIEWSAQEGYVLQTICADHGWVGPDLYDYTHTDEAIAKTLKAAPNALLLLRVMMVAPGSWMDAYPDEITGYLDEASWTSHGMSGPRHPSFASERWRRDGAEALRRLIRHLREAGYADNILGIHIAAGIYGEWHYWNSIHYPDNSSVFVEAYRQWLVERYPEDPPEPRVPTIEERSIGSVGALRDPEQSRWLIDYSRFLHEQGADALIEFARAVKEESDGRCLTLAFNGYLPDLNWNREGDHLSFHKVLRSPYLDAFSSPHSYVRRAPGDDAVMRSFPETVRALGKLWVDEEDDRTSLANDPTFTHVENMEQSIEVLWRGFARALTHNCGLWYMDQQGGWYRHPAVWDSFRRMLEIGRESLDRPRTRSSEIAVIASYETGHYLADRRGGNEHLSNLLINDQLAALSRCGAPFDLYQATEMAEADLDRYRLIVFLETWYMTDEEYELARRLVESGKPVVFFYAPGILSDEGLDIARTEALIGTPLAMTESATVDGGLRQEPGIVASEHPDEPVVRVGNVTFVPSGVLPAAELKELVREAGGHVYLDTEDVLMVGGGYVALHAASTGEKRLALPHPSRITDLRTGDVLLAEGTEVTIPMQHGQTLLLQVDEEP